MTDPASATTTHLTDERRTIQPLDVVVAALDRELRTADIPDYPGALNGLQVANAGSVHRVAVAVDATLATITAALDTGADLLVVHHGLFWDGTQPVVGVRFRKYQALLTGGLAVYASHLPLDLHPVHGNNVRLARAIGVEPSAPFARFQAVDIGVAGVADMDTHDVLERLEHVVSPYGGRVRSTHATRGRRTRRWAICTGGGASSDTLREARARGIDTLIVGEGPHHTTVDALEHDICILYAGHYATETLGVQALGVWLAEQFALPWTFLHQPTGS